MPIYYYKLEALQLLFLRIIASNPRIDWEGLLDYWRKVIKIITYFLPGLGGLLGLGIRII